MSIGRNAGVTLKTGLLEPLHNMRLTVVSTSAAGDNRPPVFLAYWVAEHS